MKMIFNLLLKCTFFFSFIVLLNFETIAQVPIGYYDFEDNSNRNTTVETSIQEAVSTIGSPSVSVTSLTSSHGAGNGASVTYGGVDAGYSIGYYGFTTNLTSASSNPNIQLGPFNCTGFSTLSLSMDVLGVGTQMPSNVDIYYSLNNITYTRIVATTTVTTSYTTRTLTIPVAANGQGSVYFRIIGFGAGASPTSTDGVMQIDNFTLQSSLVTASTNLVSSVLQGIGLSSGGSFVPTYTSLSINGAAITVNASSNLTLGTTAGTTALVLTNGIFDIGNNTLTLQTANTLISRTTGTLTLGTTANLIFGTAGNIAGNAFTIPANTFTATPAINSLTVNRTNALTWNTQGITLDGVLTLTAGALSIGTSTFTFQTEATPIVRTAGTITVATTSNLVFGTQASNFTIPNGTFTAAPSLNNLTINRAGGVTIGNQAFTINGTLNLSNGVFDIQSTLLSFQTGATPISRTAGTITTAIGSSLSFGTQATGFTIPDNTFTTTPSITNLTVNRAGGVTVGNQAFTINGTLTLTTGILNVLNTTLTFQNGNTPLARTTGTLTLGTTANLIFGTAGNIAGNAFTIPASTFTAAPAINSLTINRTNALTWNTQGITLDGVLTLTAGVLSIGITTFTFQTEATPIQRTAGTITVATTSNLVFGTQATNFTIPNGTFTAAPSLNNLTINRAGGVTVGDQAFTINGTLNLSNGVFDIQSTLLSFQTGATPISRTAGTITTATASNLSFGTQATGFTIPDNTFTTTPSITNLTINRAGGVTVGNQAFTINGTLTLTTGVLNVLNTTLTFQNGNTPIARTTGTLTLGTTANLIFGTAGNIGGNAFTIPASTFTATPAINSLTVNRTNALTWNTQGITLDGVLTLSAGALSIGTSTFTFQTEATPIVRTAGTITVATTSNLVFGTQASNFTIPNGTFTAAPSLNNLTINRAGGVTVGDQAFTINGALNLTNGVFDVQSTLLSFQTGATPINRTAGTITTTTGSSLSFGTQATGFTIPDNTFTTTPSITNLTVNRAGGVTIGNQAFTINGTLTLTTGVLNVLNTTLTFQNGNTPIARTTGTLTLGTTSNLIFGTTGNEGGNAFTIPASTFTATPAINSLTVNRINALTWNTQGITLDGVLTLTAGVLSVGTSTFTFQTEATPIQRTAGTITVATTSNLVFGTQASNFTIPNGTFTAAPSLNNLTINRAGGVTVGDQAFTINGTLNLTTGVLNVLNTTLTFQNGNTPLARTTGTLTLGTTANLIFGTAGNIGGNAFTIPASTFTTTPAINNLTVNRTNALTWNTQDITLDGVLTLTAGVLNVLNTTLIFQNGNTPIARTTGTLTLGTTANLIFGTTGNEAGNAFTIPASTFTATPAINNLTVNRTNALTWNTQGITLDGVLTLTAGELSLGTSTFTFQTEATPIVRTAGTITVATTSNMVFGTQASNFTIPNGTFTAAPSLNNLTINRAGGVTVGDQAFTINGTLTLTTGVLNVLNTTLTFQNSNTPIASTTGTLTLGTTANLIFGTAGNVGGNAFTIPANTFTATPAINSLTVNRTNALTWNTQGITLDGVLTLTAGALSIGTSTFTFQTEATPIVRTAGTITVATTSNLVFGTQTSNFTIPNGTFTAAPSLNNLTIDRAGGVTIGNQAFTINGTLNLSNGVFDIQSTLLSFQTGATPISRTAGTITTAIGSSLSFGTQATGFTIPDNTFTTTPSITNLTINRAGGVTIGNQAFTINGTLTLTTGVLNVLNTTLTFQNGNTPIARTTGTLTLGTTANLVFGTAGNIAGNAFTIPANTFTATPAINSLTVNRTNALTWNTQGITLDGVLTLTAGALSIGTSTFTFQTEATPIVRTAGTITVATTSNLVFGTQASNFTIPNGTFTAAPSLNNLTVNRAGGVTIGNQAFTINGTLNLTNGVFDIQSTLLSFQTGATPISRTAGTITTATASNLSFGTQATGFTIPDNTFTTTPSITNLTVNRAGGVTIGNQAFTINGTLTLTTGVLNVLNTTLTFQNGNTPIARTTGTLTLGTTANLIFGTAGNMGGNAFTIPASSFTATPAINSLTVNRTNALTLGNQSLVLNGTLALTSGVFNIANNTLTLQNTDIPFSRVSGTLTVGGAANIIFGTIGNTGGAAFTIPNGFFTATPPSFANFTINRTNELTLNSTQGLTLSGSLNLIEGTLNNAGRNINVSGNISGSATVTGAGLVLMTTASTTISGATITNLELNNATGFSLSGSPTMTSSLSLTNGPLNVGAHTITFHSGNTPIIRTAGTINLIATSNLIFGTSGNIGGNAFVIPNNTFTSSAPSFANFSMNRTNSLTLNNQNFSLTGLLTITAGQLVLPNSYLFTLKSSSITNTAMVAPVGVSGGITYNSGSAFIVERFIPQTGGTGRRAYRDIAPAINSGTGKIFDNWQEAGTNGLLGGVYFGTHITGFAGALPGVNGATGFDITTSGSKTLFTNDIHLGTGNSAWITANSTNQTNDTLSAFKGYRVLIRGNRLVDLFQSPTPSTMNAAAILRSSGKLVTGDVVFNTSGVTANGANNTGIRLNFGNATGYTMIGNPYQSAVDWDLLFTDPSTSNLSSTYTLWDPNLSTSGAYATYNQATGISAPLTSSINKYIQPGQAIFVQNTSTNPTLTFKETHKNTNTSNLTTTFRASSNATIKSTIYVDLKKQIDANFEVIDGVAVTYGEDYSNTIGVEDSYKFENFEENISITSNKKQLAIEGRQAPTINDEINLYLTDVKVKKAYHLNINLQHFVSNTLQAYLNDHFKNEQIKLNMFGETTYLFEKNEKETSLENRFSIVFKPKQAVALTKQLESIELPTNIIVFPNPIKNKILNLQLNNLKPGNYNLQLINLNGQTIFAEKYLHPGGSATKSFKMDRLVVSGIYQLIISGENYHYTTKIIVE